MDIKIDINNPNGQLISTSFVLAECWDQVRPDLYPALAKLYLARETDMGPYERTVGAFSVLASDAWETIKQLSGEELYDLLPLVNWVFDKLDIAKNLQPVITIGGTAYLGPADEMENLRFAEFCAADTFFINYTENEDIFHLHQLAATLYRPAGIGDEYIPVNATWRGDSREKFNDQLLKMRTGLMSKLPESVIMGIYLFYASCRHRIIEMYPKVFTQSKKKSKKSVGWLDIYDELRGDPKYTGAGGNLDEEFLHSVLFSMQRNNIKMTELKDKYDI